MVGLNTQNILQWVWWFWEVDRVACEGSQSDRGNVWSQVEEEGVQSSPQANGGEDAKTNPVATPQDLTLYT